MILYKFNNDMPIDSKLKEKFQPDISVGGEFATALHLKNVREYGFNELNNGN